MPTTPADRLVAARSGERVAARDVTAPDLATAYAIQDATVAALGAVGGWKVGASSPEAEPNGAPLPAAGLLPSGAVLEGPAWGLRGVEPEVALRLRRDLAPDEAPATLDDRFMDDAFDAVLPVIEAVDTRLADWREADSLTRLADLGTHGALILGTPSPILPSRLDLATVEVDLLFDGASVRRTVGGNTARDVRRLLAWLIPHAARRGQPLRAGQIVTTGSLAGMPFATAGARVEARLTGIGDVTLRF